MITPSSAQYDVVWEDLRLGEQPYPIAVRSQGRTMQERALIRNRVYGELTARRLAEGPRVHPDLAQTLTLLASAPTSVDMVWSPDRHASTVHNVLAVAAGDQGLLAELTGDGLRLTRVAGPGIVMALLGLLPAVPAAPGQSIAVPTEALAPSGEHAVPDQDSIYHPTGPRGTATAQQVRALQALFARPRLRGGQIVVNVRGRHGRRHRSRPLEWFDTEDGRCLAQTGDGADGRQHLLVAPADNARIAARVHEMLAVLGASAGSVPPFG